MLLKRAPHRTSDRGAAVAARAVAGPPCPGRCGAGWVLSRCLRLDAAPSGLAMPTARTTRRPACRCFPCARRGLDAPPDLPVLAGLFATTAAVADRRMAPLPRPAVSGRRLSWRALRLWRDPPCPSWSSSRLYRYLGRSSALWRGALTPLGRHAAEPPYQPESVLARTRQDAESRSASTAPYHIRCASGRHVRGGAPATRSRRPAAAASPTLG